MLDALVRGIRAAGLEVSTQELQDILWAGAAAAPRASRRQTSGMSRYRTPGRGARRTRSPAERRPQPHDDEMSRIDGDAPPRAGAGAAPTAVHARTLAGTISASTLRVPGVASTEFPDDLRRALQPFARRVAVALAHGARRGRRLPSTRPTWACGARSTSRCASAGSICGWWWRIRRRWPCGARRWPSSCGSCATRVGSRASRSTAGATARARKSAPSMGGAGCP